MGRVIRFPGRQHARASSAIFNPKTAGETSTPLAFSASLMSKKLSDVIFPRSRQLLTAGKLTPTKPATAAVPPSASMTASTEVSMPTDTSRNVKMSSLSELEIVTSCEVWPYGPMTRGIKSIGDRLKRTFDALDVTPAEVCRRTGITQTQLSQFLGGKNQRRITVDASYRLRDEFRLTLDWIYDGDPSGLPNWLAAKLKKDRAA